TETTGLVYNPAAPPLISTTTTLRAAAFRTGWTPTNVDTQTYIFLNSVIQQSGAGLPAHASWGWAGPDWAMDPAVVNDPLYASAIKSDLQAIPTVSLVMPWSDWFGGAGVGIYPTDSELERGTSMEYFTADGSQEFQIDGGIEIQGGTSDARWRSDKLSLRIKFKQPYGPEKLDADLFAGSVLGEGAAVEFNTLVLDAGFNYTWTYGGGLAPTDQRGRARYIQDQVAADVQNLAGGYAPRGRAVHLYINGLYWGMYLAHERPDEHFAESYLGGADEDYDVIKHTATTVVSGDATAVANYDAMLTLARQDMSVLANYTAAAQKIDVDGLAAYMAINYYIGNDDWPHHNWYATYNRVDPNGKWRFHSWDAEHSFKDLNYNAIQTGDFLGTPEEVHSLLMASPEYRLRFADAVQKHTANGGVLTPARIAEIYQARMNEVDRAIVGESARWGDNRTTGAEGPGAGNAYTRAHWLASQNDLLANYFPQRTGVVLGQFAARNWLLPQAAPVLNNYGGVVAPGYQLTIARPPGAPAGSLLYYTTDGSDPRAPGGGVAPGAIQAPGGSAAIAINAGMQVRARVFDAAQAAADQWSPEIDARFLLETPFPLRITELHYNPAGHPGVADSGNLEFIELLNTGSQTISLDGVQITQFASAAYAFAPGQTLAAGDRILVARSPATLLQAYGPGLNVAAAGYANANLSNSGEQVVLVGPLGETLQSILYSEGGAWPSAADGGGKSLEIIDPLGDETDPANWRASFYVGGSPGSAGLPPAVAGDFDGDGDADGNDFERWQRGLGTPALQGSAAKGDADGDRDVDAGDLALWRTNYGEPQVAAAVVSAADPAASRKQPPGPAAGLVERPIMPATYTSLAQAAAALKGPAARTARPAYRPSVRVTLPQAPVSLPPAAVASLVGYEALDSLFANLGDEDDPASLAAEALSAELALVL
ncbi:MAG TPA: CotH kinase family protein, partial [Lacipirellulaceae bacterium]|nr:CotH kinase family protein [Lacipirellulaceae bacterium]